MGKWAGGKVRTTSPALLPTCPKETPLARIPKPATLAFMKFIYSLAVWLIMGTALGWGILLAIGGSPWLLLVSVLGFIFAVAKFGCLSSH